eukprot:TRINITY_DN25931_c0_g1_i1.p1 TRINITY_DN25931_c0_g1~~TRINITY_DN25931_c0_g1_i1.p1  ORF type:complete len:433 (+),score=188.74 TRINITY_DN25931_c0_g1_i1:62-1360(+)
MSKYASLLARRKQYLHPVHRTLYSEPMMLTSGDMQYLFDDSGRKYLDMFGGVTTVSVGHSHPKVTEAASRQAAKLTHATTLFLTESIIDFCEAFAQKLPNPDDWVVHVVNSGSEATDFATLQARVYTGNYMLLGLRHGYHGFTEGARGLVSVPKWKHRVPPPPGTTRLPVPSTYRGRLGTTPADLPAYIDDLKETVACETGGAVAAFFAEAIQGYAGASELIPGYLQEAYKVIRENGGLCVSDEVQCGFGRLGTHYWGFEAAGVVPDIIVTAKSVANGWPVGVVATKREVAEKMTDTMYFNTYGGNAVCTEVARTVLQIIDDEGLQGNSLRQGNRLLAGMRELQQRHPFIGHVRGSGLLLGMDMVSDPVTKTPAPEVVAAVVDGMREEGVIIGKGGPYGNVVRMAPPMCITDADTEFFLEALRKTLSRVASA